MNLKKSHLNLLVQRRRKKKNIIKRSNIHITGVLEEVQRGAESIFKELISEKFPNLGIDMDIQIYEGQKSPNMIN